MIDALSPPTSAISQNADKIGLAIAVIILLVALGSAVSMLVPISLALFALTCSSLILQILEAHATIGTVAPILGTMIGLGVGIDYSLFIVSRYRQNLSSGMTPERAAGVALATAGSAVLFAAITVCLALCGLALVRIPYVTTLGFSAALFVMVTVVAALTLLPAILGALGPRIFAWSLPHARRETQTGETLSARWAAQMARRPIVYCLVSLAVLLALASPLFGIRLGFPSDSSAPSSTTQHQAYELIDRGFGPGANGPLLLVVSLPRSPETDAGRAGRPRSPGRGRGPHARGQGGQPAPGGAGRQRGHRPGHPHHLAHRSGHHHPGPRPARRRDPPGHRVGRHLR